MDARQLKTRAKLASAVLGLATAGPVAELSVSQVAAAAGVHRSTFYEHATSPVELLEAVLRDELDALRARYLVGVTPATAPEAVRLVTAAVLEHVDAHAVIYQRGLGEGSGSASLQPLLSVHFRGSTRLLIDQGSIAIPETAGTVATSPALVEESVTSYIADGTVGAIRSWLETPSPRDRDSFLALFALMLPSWWPSETAAP